MTDRTLDISAALREAHLQHLESSLAAKSAKPATPNATTSSHGTNQDKQPASNG